MSTDLVSNMIRGPYVAEPGMGLRNGLDLMRELDIRHLPVIEEGKLIGLVSERDLKAASILPEAERLRLEDIMKREVFTVQKDAPLKMVVETMAERKIGSAVVLNARNEVVGIFTTIDALFVLVDLLGDETDEEFLLKDDLYESWEDFNDSICPAVPGSFTRV